MPNALLFLLESLVVGFIMAAPVGPVGVLCIRRTIRYGWLSGFTTGLGVALADSVYGALASLGLTSVSTTLVSHEQMLKLAGGILLLIMAVTIYRTPAPKGEGETSRLKHIRNFLSALVLAFTNPLTILSFAAVYIGLGLGAQTEGSLLYAVIFVVGVFIGSCGWWLLLSLGTERIKQRITPDYFTKINHICGAIIGLFGIGTLLSLMR
jgi:threonine/homoserine/homoserine lactone efflux protein